MRYTLFPILLLLIFVLSCNNGVSDDGDLPLEATYGMKLIPSKGATYLMGIVDSLHPSDSSSVPVCTVSFTYNFYMDITEVTQKKYHDVMSDSKHGFTKYVKPNWTESKGINDSLPAYSVSWNWAIIYCNVLSKKRGLDTVYVFDSVVVDTNKALEIYGLTSDFSKQGYRLPNEAEWEFAAREEISTDYYWGTALDNYPATESDSNEIDEQIVWYHNSMDLGASQPDYGPHKVASKTANKYGLYDMIGNVAEMCYDDYSLFRSKDIIDPVGGNLTSIKIIRGGSWVGTNIIIYRFGYKFAFLNFLYSSQYGFRVVLNETLPDTW